MERKTLCILKSCPAHKSILHFALKYFVILRYFLLFCLYLSTSLML